MTTTTIRIKALTKTDTPTLINQYRLAIASQKGRYSDTAPRQKRINLIVDMISDRADNGDPDALAFYAQD